MIRIMVCNVHVHTCTYMYTHVRTCTYTYIMYMYSHMRRQMIVLLGWGMHDLLLWTQLSGLCLSAPTYSFFLISAEPSISHSVWTSHHTTHRSLYPRQGWIRGCGQVILDIKLPTCTNVLIHVSQCTCTYTCKSVYSTCTVHVYCKCIELL